MLAVSQTYTSDTAYTIDDAHAQGIQQKPPDPVQFLVDYMYPHNGLLSTTDPGV